MATEATVETIDAPKGKKEFRFTGWHMFGLIALFFGVIISVNITMATYAVKNWTGLVVKNSYVASQSFNTRLEQAKAQAALGWTDHLKIEQTAFIWQVKDNEGNPIAAKSATVQINRPVGEVHLMTLPLVRADDGSFIVSLPKTLADGRWEIILDADIGTGAPYRAHMDIVVQSGKFEK